MCVCVLLEKLEDSAGRSKRIWKEVEQSLERQVRSCTPERRRSAGKAKQGRGGVLVLKGPTCISVWPRETQSSNSQVLGWRWFLQQMGREGLWVKWGVNFQCYDNLDLNNKCQHHRFQIVPAVLTYSNHRHPLVSQASSCSSYRLQPTWEHPWGSISDHPEKWRSPRPKTDLTPVFLYSPSPIIINYTITGLWLLPFPPLDCKLHQVRDSASFITIFLIPPHCAAHRRFSLMVSWIKETNLNFPSSSLRESLFCLKYFRDNCGKVQTLTGS